MQSGPIAYLSLEAPREGQAPFTHVNEIIAGLRRRGFTVDLFAPRYTNDADSPGVVGRLLEYVLVQLRLLPRLRGYSLIYVRAHFMAWPVAMAARLLRIPVIHEVNGHYVDIMVTYPWTRRVGGLLRSLQRAQYRAAQALITVTPQLRDWLRGEGCRQTIEVITNGANIEFFNPDRARRPGLPDRYVVFFGGFTRWQGIPTMLEAIGDPRWPKGVSLVMIGAGQLLPQVEEASASSSNLCYLGQLPYKEVGAVVVGALAGLVTSSDRNATGVFPLKLFEVMASGVPPIVVDSRGQADLVRAENCGLVIPHEDPAALAMAVAEIARDPDKWRAAGRHAHRVVAEQHTWDRRAEETADLIRRVLAAVRENRV